MIAPELAVQKSLFDALAHMPENTVPVVANGTPPAFPSIVIDDGQTVREPMVIGADFIRIYRNVHVWSGDGEGLREAIEIASSARTALEGIATIDDHQLVSGVVAGSHYMRDPETKRGHVVLSYDALVKVTH